MTTKTATKSKRRRTTTVPVTTMEEVPVLTESEREELLASLQDAEERIRAGDYTVYDPKKMKERLLRIYRGKKQ